MFEPPEELHSRFEAALEKIRGNLGQEHAMLIAGADHYADEKFDDHTPINTDVLLGTFQKGTEADAAMALNAARKAFPGWSGMRWQERVALMRKAADLIDERIFEMGAVMAL